MNIIDQELSAEQADRKQEIIRLRALLEKEIDYFFQNIGDERLQFPQTQSQHEPKSYYQRGLAKYELKQHEAAITDYDKAISLSNPLNMDPDDAYIYYQRALAKKESGRFEEAIADLQTALPLSFRVEDDPQLAVMIDHLLRERRNNGGNFEDE